MSTRYCSVPNSLTTQYSGHTIIQVQDHNGCENSVIFHAGANNSFTEGLVDSILAKTSPGDYLILQCESNEVEYIIAAAKNQFKLRIVFNPSPITPAFHQWDDKYHVDWLIVNSREARLILPGSKTTSSITDLQALRSHTKALNVIVTLGANGVSALIDDQFYSVPAFEASVVDTTGAGDVFLGFFVALIVHDNSSVELALKTACAASAISVASKGALKSIPTRQVVSAFLDRH